MKIIAWNTGALYTARGQRIAVTPLGGGRVAFLDRDRMIDGITDLSAVYDWDNPTHQGLIKTALHRRYLQNDYRNGLWGVENREQVERALRFACDQLPALEK